MAECEALGRIGNETGVVRAVVAQSVVQVRDGQSPLAGIGLDQAGRPVQEGHRVGTAGDGQN